MRSFVVAVLIASVVLVAAPLAAAAPQYRGQIRIVDTAKPVNTNAQSFDSLKGKYRFEATYDLRTGGLTTANGVRTDAMIGRGRSQLSFAFDWDACFDRDAAPIGCAERWERKLSATLDGAGGGQLRFERGRANRGRAGWTGPIVLHTALGGYVLDLSALNGRGNRGMDLDATGRLDEFDRECGNSGRYEYDNGRLQYRRLSVNPDGNGCRRGEPDAPEGRALSLSLWPGSMWWGRYPPVEQPLSASGCREPTSGTTYPWLVCGEVGGDGKETITGRARSTHVVPCPFAPEGPLKGTLRESEDQRWPRLCNQTYDGGSVDWRRTLTVVWTLQRV